MILEALVRHYESLRKEGKVPEKNWSTARVSYALCLNPAGELTNVLTLKMQEKRGKKIVDVPQDMLVPEQIHKTSGIASQFLCENSSYFLGVDQKGKPERSRKCFAASAKLHQQILRGASSVAAKAVCAFFDCWQPEEIEKYSCLTPYLEDIEKGANLVFFVDGKPAQEDPEIRACWENAAASDAVRMQCLVTGKLAPIARVHPSIKGVQGAQSSGASLVSFNAPSYESYGREQGLNAPISEYAAFAYGTMLNQLLADKKHVKTLGNTTVVYWAEQDSNAHADFFTAMISGDDENICDEDLDGIFSKIVHQEEIYWQGIKLSYSNPFYILGLAPNAARISVRFFLQSTFGKILENLEQHEMRMKIVKPAFEKFAHIPLWMLLNETVNPHSKDKAASPLMAGTAMKAILQNTPYPISLFQNIMLRIRMEQGARKINYRRAAILKACLIQNYKYGNEKGWDLVSLNETVTDVAYVLGRLFAVLEHIQQTANPELNATIKDRYFDAACTTPAKVFPILQKLSHHHLRKLNTKQNIAMRVFFEKQLTDIMGKIEAGAQPLPTYLSLEKQSVFVLGYYHQTQKRYEKKEDKKDDGRN